jgi:hypothetical protein
MRRFREINMKKTAQTRVFWMYTRWQPGSQIGDFLVFENWSMPAQV